MSENSSTTARSSISASPGNKSPDSADDASIVVGRAKTKTTDELSPTDDVDQGSEAEADEEDFSRPNKVCN